MTATTRQLFDDLVNNAESLFTEDDFAIMKTYGKAEAVSRLHLSVGARIRDTLGLWDKDSMIKLDAIYEHANQGILLGYDADGGSSALLEYIWDERNNRGQNTI